MSKIAWAVIIGIVIVAMLALGAGVLFPFWARGLGYGMMRPGIVGGFGIAWPFLLLRGVGSFLFWLLLFVGLFLIIRSLAGQSSASGVTTITGESPLDILKRRYAKGEINKEQFEEMRNTLGG
jgi:putative membrane protein